MRSAGGIVIVGTSLAAFVGVVIVTGRLADAIDSGWDMLLIVCLLAAIIYTLVGREG